eukprot:CAMPEP_0119037240 /NCGR_PEP_ID=MMETSP1177-20130426/5486_1 /TAXON_ID=2985 /ORGANISM="Ochromonas sp, Strain CCMP1899" /LENGTH=370 /DNA_ID=CAMNT_0006998249 /DNA_START=554 /DNA_END=1669 /DNA_ORIENTATION=-
MKTKNEQYKKINEEDVENESDQLIRDTRKDRKNENLFELRSTIEFVFLPPSAVNISDGSGDKEEITLPMLQCVNLTVNTPDGRRTLIGAVQGDVFFKKNTDMEKEGKSSFFKNNSGGYGSKGEYGSGKDRGVNFEVYEGDKILVSGPSGTGKSSLLRAISGLWELGSGSVIWKTNFETVTRGKSIAPEGVFFLPQKPYNLLGSLRQQIAYPSIYPGEEIEGDVDLIFDGRSRKNSISISPIESDEELLEILRKVKLDNLALRTGAGDERVGLGEHRDWSKVLSLGEQQRLAFARVLYNRRNISVAILDEATSALDEVSEAAMYTLLDKLNLTYMSVGHRSSLYRYHTKKIVLNGPGCEVQCAPIIQELAP